MIPELGVIEGYFGRAWSWAERAAVVSTLAPAGYSFFHYAPKIDGKLRRHWRVLHSAREANLLRTFAQHCSNAKVRFGIGLSPYGAHIDFDNEAKAALRVKIAQLNTIGTDDLIILFDDMRGDYADLAERQAEIVAFAVEHSNASRFFMCPSYYSDDPMLDRVFGKRPRGYLETLGQLLYPEVSVYWTGEEVCSREYSIGHLANVAERLGRKPSIWDNYPVNDGPHMSGHLHLRAFTGRPSEVAPCVTHHAINPASQPILSCIPALTLPMSYREGNAYCYGAAFLNAAAAVCGTELALMLQEDLKGLQDIGLAQLGERKALLRAKYANINHATAREVVDWLADGYAITGEMIRTQ